MVVSVKQLEKETELLTSKLDLLVTERQTEKLLDEAEAIAFQLRKILRDERIKESTKERAFAALAAAAILLATKPDVHNLAFNPGATVVQQVVPSSNQSNAFPSPERLLKEAKKLFATAQSLGAIAVGHAEGNYNSRGKVQGNYFGHIDPGNPKPTKNMGFCSDQGRGGGDIDRANAACLEYIVGSFPSLIKKFQEAKTNPTIFEFLNVADLYNQANPQHSRLFAAKLVEVRQKLKDKNLSEVEIIANTRAATFWINGKNTAKGLERACSKRPDPPDTAWDCVYGDQLRRVEAIARVLERENISLEAPLVKPTKKEIVSLPKPAFQFPQLNFFGNQAQRAPQVGPSEQDLLAAKLIKYMEGQNYEIARHPREINLVFLRNSKKATNQWSDKLFIIKFVNKVPKIVGEWNATTAPGEHYIKFGKDIGAPFTIAGQHKVWQVGNHIGVIEEARGGKGHEALIQTGGQIKVLRDANKDGIGDTPYEGFYGINIHGSKNQSTTVGQSSAGCLVIGGEGVGMRGIQQVMKFVKSDRRYLSNKQFIFPATVIENWKL